MAVAATAALQRRSFIDDESSVGRIEGWNIDCLQLSAGVLDGESIDVHMPSTQLLFETFRNVSTSHCGTAPGDAVVFGIACAMAGEGRFNGQPWVEGVTAFDSRYELVSVVPPVELITLVVDRQTLLEHARVTAYVDLERWLSAGPVMVSDADLSRRVAARLGEVREACRSRCLQAEGPSALVDEVLELLCALVVHRLCSPPTGVRGRSPAELVRRARRLVHERADEPPSIFDLCSELRVSRRWLQWSFNQVLGMGPHTYLHLMRLNGARRLLLRADRDTRVSDAIEAFGFWHPSRFSHDYRRHFGELPSQTLRRAQAQR